MKNKFKITYDTTDKLLQEALDIDRESYSKHNIGSYDKCKEWELTREVINVFAKEL